MYIVAGGSSKHFPTVASYLMTLKTLLMLRETRRDTIFVCLTRPGYAKYRSQTGKSSEEYIALTDEDGIPIDEFIALSVYDWSVFPSFVLCEMVIHLTEILAVKWLARFSS